MTEQEWDAFTLELAQSFRGTFGQQSGDDANGRAQELVYRSHFAAFDYPVMVAAVVLLVQDGQVFTPAPGELMAAVRRVHGAGAPPFAEVWRVFEVEFLRPRGGDVDREEEIVTAVHAECGEGAARWVQTRGVRALSLELIHDPEHGGKVRHRLEGELATFVAQAAEDRKVGLALNRAREAAQLTGGPARRGLRPVSMGAITAGDADS